MLIWYQPPELVIDLESVYTRVQQAFNILFCEWSSSVPGIVEKVDRCDHECATRMHPPNKFLSILEPHPK